MADKPRIYCDINIVLNLILDRENAHRIEKYMLDTDAIWCISAASLPTLWYILEKQDLATQETVDHLSHYTLLDSTSEDSDFAYTIWQYKEFEDALHIATAIHNGCTIFLTRDTALGTKYSNYIEMKVV